MPGAGASAWRARSRRYSSARMRRCSANSRAGITGVWWNSPRAESASILHTDFHLLVTEEGLVGLAIREEQRVLVTSRDEVEQQDGWKSTSQFRTTPCRPRSAACRRRPAGHHRPPRRCGATSAAGAAFGAVSRGDTVAGLPEPVVPTCASAVLSIASTFIERSKRFPARHAAVVPGVTRPLGAAMRRRSRVSDSTRRRR